MCRGRIQWWQSRTVSAVPVVGWISSAGEGSTASACPFHHGLNVIVPLQVLGDGGTHESEWLHCSHSTVHDGEWGESGGSPEVHDHLHCFEHVQLQFVKTDSHLFNILSVSRLVTVLNEAISVVSSVNFRSLTEGSLDEQSFVYREKSSGERTQPWGAPVLIVQVLDVYFPSLTNCCLSVRKLVIHWQMEVGMENWVSLGKRRFGMIVLKAELKSTNRILR